jgi:hypothetical protein
MLNNDESSPGNAPQQGRRPPLSKPYQENRFSRSASFNYNSGAGFSAQQQHPKRRTDRFKREALNHNDRLLKQNDMIIRLLTEIRDRLPPPLPGTPQVTVDTNADSSKGHESSGGNTNSAEQ